ncbi:MAG TPA: pyruvate dehydrogenase (acetyl-transferring) E1 component subunit alpha [Thermodesulfovibrionales bacterium]|nr:pyruvate dehydrogenase (acetyl-transferring) E1 component subunit alpha [Thermodesulfovibrionales bacterium]
MPEKILESFTVKRLDILDEGGNVDQSLMPPLSDEDIRRFYEVMVLARSFDQLALNLQREGRIGTYASILGQEASQIGSALALDKTDWAFPSFRENGVYIAVGHPPYKILQYWGGDERGLVTEKDVNVFPICIPVATHVPHASGAAMAAKYRGHKIGVVAYFGDGGTSEGDFHEGLNFAGVFRLPVVFICQNNQWAISVPREKQTAAKTIAQKAVAYGFEGIQVDGNDIFAVYKATKEALDRAKRGEGPTLIECFTYRMSDHTTADDAARYRAKEEVDKWKAKDPILRLKLFMQKKGIWTEEYSKGVEAQAKAAVDDAEKKAEAVERPDPRDMFTYTYQKITARQIRELKDF